MNLLKNKQLLRSLLHQGDYLNTINGGVSKTAVDTVQTDKSFIINVSSPSVAGDAFNIMLHYNQLIIYSILKKGNNQEASDQLAMSIPMFMKSFEVPAYVDINKIEAVHEEGVLKVILPFKDHNDGMQRKINIKHLNK